MLLTGLVFFSHSSDSIKSKIAVEMTYRKSIIFVATRKIFISKANCQGNLEKVFNAEIFCCRVLSPAEKTGRIPGI